MNAVAANMSGSLRIAATAQFEPAIRAAGFEPLILPRLPDEDIHRSLEQRLADGEVIHRYLTDHPADLLIDVDTAALTLTRKRPDTNEVWLTSESLGLPYVSCYIDPITSTCNRVPWIQHWAMLEQGSWIKAVWEIAHAQELIRLGIPQVLRLPMGLIDRPVDLTPAEPDMTGPVLTFIGHPATAWFNSQQSVLPRQLMPGLIAAAVNADQPGTPFHVTYYDLYRFAEPPLPEDGLEVRARKAAEYFNAKFVYNAYLALRQRDRFVMFLSRHLEDRFELVGDFWDSVYGLPHRPRIWDYDQLFRRMREVPICLNLVKGCLETGLNLRHFEVTAAGGFLLTYWTPELESMFVVGRECESFRNEKELLEKIRYYLARPQQRQDIALAGQRRTLSEHLYSHRLQELVNRLRGAGVLSSDIRLTLQSTEPGFHPEAGRNAHDHRSGTPATPGDSLRPSAPPAPEAMTPFVEKEVMV